MNLEGYLHNETYYGYAAKIKDSMMFTVQFPLSANYNF